MIVSQLVLHFFNPNTNEKKVVFDISEKESDFITPFTDLGWKAYTNIQNGRGHENHVQEGITVLPGHTLEDFDRVLAENSISKIDVLRIQPSDKFLNLINRIPGGKTQPRIVVTAPPDKISESSRRAQDQLFKYFKNEGYTIYFFNYAPNQQNEIKRKSSNKRIFAISNQPGTKNENKAFFNMIFVQQRKLDRREKVITKLKSRLEKKNQTIRNLKNRGAQGHRPEDISNISLTRVAKEKWRNLLRQISWFLLEFSKKRSDYLRKIFSNLEWRYRLQKVKKNSGQNDFNKNWGNAKRDHYRKWGPVPCSKKDVKKIQTLHNKFKGERIFVIGNGPSLNSIPLAKLENEYTFGVNRINLLFDRINWKPTFYTVHDWRLIPDNLDEINSLRDMTFFFPQGFKGMLRNGPDVYWFWAKNPANTGDTFAYDISHGLSLGGTILVQAIQIAYYLGFNPIYLIGVDFNYKILGTVKQTGKVFKDGSRFFLTSTKDDDPNHFVPNYFGKGRRWHNPDLERMQEGFEECRKAIEAQGKQILNATPGTQLKVIPKVDYLSLFNS